MGIRDAKLHAKKYEKEAELCADFNLWAATQGWVAYNETCGWDVLLAHADGTQIGVQAKLRLNVKVLEQAIEPGSSWQDEGPDFRAVLVPLFEGSSDLCDALGLTLIRHQGELGGAQSFAPDIELRKARWRKWHFMNPKRRHQLPQYVPDVAAGVPGPSQLSDWKIAALKITAVIELRGYVTRQDFRNFDIDHRRWVEAWLEPIEGERGAWRWRRGQQGRFANKHPTIYPLAREEVKKLLATVLL